MDTGRREAAERPHATAQPTGSRDPFLLVFENWLQVPPTVWLHLQDPIILLSTDRKTGGVATEGPPS